MLIVCPSCASQYELDAAKLGPGGRKVRCANCKTSWHVEPEAAFPDAPDAAETQALLEEELVRAAAIEAEISAVTAEADARIAAAATEAATDASPDTGAEIEPDAESVPLVVTPAARRKKLQRGASVSRNAASGSRVAMRPAAAALAGLALLALLVWQRNAAVRMAPQLADVFALAGLPVNVRGLSLSAVESGLVDDGQSRYLVVEGDVTNITRHKTSVPSIEVAVNDAAGTTLYTWTTQPPRPTLEPAELVRFRARLASPPEKGQSVRVRFTSATTAANIAAMN